MTKPQTPAGVVNQVPAEELGWSFDGPALHTNKFYVSGLGPNVRVSFMESLGDKVAARFRAAVLMSIADATQLRDLLTTVLDARTRAESHAVEIGHDIGSKTH